MEQPKPKRKFSKTRSDLAMFFCFAVITYIVVFKDTSPIAETVVSFAFATIVGILGIYQSIGFLDFKANKNVDYNKNNN